MCGAGEGGDTHKRVYQDEFVPEQSGEKQGENPRQCDMGDAASLLSSVSATVLCPIAHPFLGKGGNYTERWELH